MVHKIDNASHHRDARAQRIVEAGSAAELQHLVREILADSGQLHEGEPWQRTLERVVQRLPRLAAVLQLAIARFSSAEIVPGPG